MSTQIKVAEQWMDGFVKAAEAVGLTQEQAGELFKLSARLQARSTNPAAFDAGYDEVMAKAADYYTPEMSSAASTNHTGQLVKTGAPSGRLGAIFARLFRKRGMKTLGLLGAAAGGGAAVVGGQHFLEGEGGSIAEGRMIRDLVRANRLQEKHRAYANMLRNAPGVTGGAPGGAGGYRGGYGNYRSPYAPF